MKSLSPRYNDPLPPNEIAVLVEIGVDAIDIEIFRKSGGYRRILRSNETKIDLQDVLDNVFGRRIVNVRNALRRYGWATDGSGEQSLSGPLYKTIADSHRLMLSLDIEHVGAGGNVAGVKYVVSSAPGPDVRVNQETAKIAVPDLLCRGADDMAALIESWSPLRVARVSDDLRFSDEEFADIPTP